MKRCLQAFIIALAGLLLASSATGADASLLWQIGKADGGNAEFALAPKDYSQFTEDGFFIVGQSDAARDWPYVHPGPADSWAGGRAHTFAIVFGVKKAPRKGKCVLRLKLHDTHHDALPNIRVVVNDESFEAPQPEGTNTVAKPFYTMWEFPTSLLRTGNNRIAIVNTKGSWFRYDRIALETPAPVQLAPVANAAALIAQAHPPPAKIEQVIVVFKTHFDIGYTEMASNVVHRYRTTMIDQALEVVDQNCGLPPAQQFAWTIPGWPLHQILDWPEQTPERKARVERALKDGRFVVHALPFTLHTETLELEDLVRGLGHSSRIARRLSLPLPRDAKMTDVPCHAWVMPTLLKRAGVEFLHIGCNSASSSPRVPEMFWWEGPDSSRLLTYYSAGGYGSGLMPPRDWPHKTWLALIHTGDNHGPPTPAEVKKLLDQAAKQLPGVKVRIGRLSDFADAVLAEKPKLKVVRGDMPDTWIHGPMCDPIGAKIGRNIRPDIATAEALGTLLDAWKVKPSSAAAVINDAYEQSLLYGEHTWGAALWWLVKYEGGAKFGYGDAWRQVMAKGHFKRHEESWAEHTAYIEKARDLTAPLLDRELRALAQAVGGNGRRIVVFNPLAWKRSSVVSVKVDATFAALKPADGGDAVPVESSGGSLRFVARDVPALGYRVFVPVKAELPPTKLRADEKTATIESVFFKATLDPARGSIRSIVDKRTGRELVNPGFGQYLYERFDSNSVAAYVNAYVKSRAEWAVNQLGKPFLPPTSEVPYRAASPRDCKFSIAQTSVSVSATMTSAARPDLPHPVTTRLILYADAPWADLEVTLHDKPADPWPEAGWICLPFNATSPRFRVGRPGAVIDPARDIVASANHDLYAVTTGAAMLDARNSGAGFCAPDTPMLSLGRPGGWKYDPTFVPDKATAFVNLFNNQWTTNFRFWNSGTWTARVRIWAINRYDADAALITPSLETRSPMLAVAADGAPGKLPPTQRGLELSRKGVQVTAFGANPDGEGTVLRLWELAGKGGSCQVRLPAGMNAKIVQPVNLRGVPEGKPLAVRNGAFTASLKAFAPASFMIQTRTK